MRKKPLIIFDNSSTDPRGQSYKNNERQQNLLLKGVMLTGNLIDAGKYAGIKRTVDLYRTWDRLSMRKDYHLALMEQEIDLNWLVGKLKNQAENADKDSVRLEALKIILRSLGLDKYEKEEETSKGWEQALANYVEKQDALPSPAKKTVYDVKTPQIPESAKKIREEDNTLGKELYEK